MPKYQAPTSDASRLSFLQTAVKTATGADAGKNYVTAATITAVQAFVPQFAPAATGIAGLLAHRVQDVAQREAARATLDTCLSDFWEVLKRRVHRKGEPAAVLAFYKLPADGSVPAVNTFADLTTMAAEVIAGDAQAVAAGHPAMANPDAAELQAALTAANAVAGNVPTSDRAYDDAQKAIAALRPRADELIGDVMDDLRNSLRKTDYPSQRRVMRTYGATFTPLPGEPADPTPAPVTPPSP